jgi:class 3 adenylate cyclase
MSQVIDDAVRAGREALERHDWSRAFELLQEADAAGGLAPEDLELLAEAAWWTGRPVEATDARERAFAGYVGQDNRRRAAKLALDLRLDYIHRLNNAVARGWLKRAEKLLEEEPESVEHGYLALAYAPAARIKGGDLDTALEHARRALDIGSRFGDRDLQALALSVQGHYLVAKGEIEEGLAFLDEATVGAVGGELSPFVAGLVYCRTITACEEMADYRRAGEWNEAAKRWCERQSISGFPGVCRVHRAEVTRLRGAWAEAESEARRASEELEQFGMLDSVGDALCEIGEIRLRTGDLAGAEEAFARAREFGADPQPGLSMLRLLQDKPDAALSSISHALEEGLKEPLSRAHLLPALVEIAVAAGDLGAAHAAVGELEEISAAYGSSAIHASTHQSRGTLLLAEGDGAGAQGELRLARKHWQETDAPYEAALSGVLLAQAYRMQGERDAAAMELETAKSAFTKLGARLDAARCVQLLAEQETARATGERAVRTFMFTDIVKSTNLVEAIGDEAWQDLLRWHDQNLRSLFAAHGGQEVTHTGDGFFVAFESAEQALACAVAIQSGLADHRRTQGFAPQLRVGLHAAEATDVGGDYRGKGVHEAARIGALAEGGEILVSREFLQDGPVGFPVSEPRTVSLKGLSRPMEVSSIDWRT